MVHSPLRLGLTGGIGSGKSTVAEYMAQAGAGVVDADAISRASTAAGGSAIPLILTQFGSAFIDERGALHRERMRAHVFGNPTAKKTLEAIIHPLVGRAIADRAEQLTHAGKTCIVYDIPLLVESAHWRTQLDRILVVDCLPETQVRRVVARSGLSEDEVQKIITAQAPRLSRLAAADAVLFNDGISLQELAAEVGEISQQFGL